MRTRLGVMDVTFPTSRTCTGIRTQTQQLLKLSPLPLGYTGIAGLKVVSLLTATGYRSCKTPPLLGGWAECRSPLGALHGGQIYSLPESSATTAGSFI